MTAARIVAPFVARRATRTRAATGAALVLALTGLLPIATAAGTAAGTLPTDWCAPEPSSTDRPDTVAGHQIHVVYAHPADAPDRTTTLAPRIVRDLGGVDAWWRGQDPGRTPRFDLAAFADCDSPLGALDLTTLALPGPSTAYANPDTTLAASVRTELQRVLGPKAGTVYLVYLDAPVGPFHDQVVCGLAAANTAFVFLQQSPGCSPGGGLGAGDGWPASTAAHELTHLFTNGPLTGAPHACPDDDGHICEPGSGDLLDTASPRTSPFLSDMVLDPGRDDYYGHGIPGRIDVRASEYLARLDAPQQPVTVAVTPDGGGRVTSAGPGIACPPACSIPFDGDTTVRLVATAADGYVFRGWSGSCSGPATQCAVVADSALDVTATFEALVAYRVRVVGSGRITTLTDACDARCTWDAPARTTVDLHAEPERGARFAGWSGACAGERARCRVRIGKAVRVVATFERR